MDSIDCSDFRQRLCFGIAHAICREEKVPRDSVRAGIIAQPSMQTGLVSSRRGLGFLPHSGNRATEGFWSSRLGVVLLIRPENALTSLNSSRMSGQILLSIIACS